MFVIGLTSGIACGKSIVAGAFKENGARVIDADKIVHRLYRSDSSLKKKLVKAFGKMVLKGKKKVVDRNFLSGLVFSSKTKLRKLNAIVHPFVLKELEKEIRKYRERLLVLDISLLFEANALNLVDFVVVVKTTKAKQLKQLMERNNLSRKEALKRIDAQMPLKKKIALADFVVDNSKSVSFTKKQVRLIVEFLRCLV